MTDPRPWDAELREDLHRRGDQLVVDVEPALRAVRVSSAARRRRTRLRSTGAVLAAAAGVAAVVLIAPVLRDSPSTPPADRHVQPVPTQVVPPDLLRTWQRTVPSPTSVAGDWSMRPAPSTSGVLTLTVTPSGPSTDGVAYEIVSDRLRVNAFANDLCANLAVGVYRWSVSNRVLTLTPVSDRCPARAAVFAGRWMTGGSQ